MQKRCYPILFVLGLCVIGAVASMQTAPGYMDAEYYYSGSVQLANGHGFQENFVWNYLDNPQAAPHPSHTYWMPMASLLGAIFPTLLGQISFSLARIPFVIIGALLVPLTAGLTYTLTKNQGFALFSGVQAAFPGYYLAFLPTTDTFGVFMLLGTAFLLTAASLPERFTPDAFPKVLGLGICAGLLHLSRADGLLWLGYAWLAILWAGRSAFSIRAAGGPAKPRPWQSAWVSVIAAMGCAGVGYLVVMAPWLLRNLSIYGTLLSPGASRAIWERSYNELYNYPPETLTFATWWSQGLGIILQQRLSALWTNLQSALGVQMEILLAPFILVGLWRLRKVRLIQLAVAAWLLTLAVMSFVYPFAGARGGFFHSGSAVQPILWAVAPSGFDAVIGWAARKRRWKVRDAVNFFTPAVTLIVILLTGFITYQKVLGPDAQHPAWNKGLEAYRELESEVRKLDPTQKVPVLVNNPAGYSLVSDRPAYAIPNGDVETLLAVARRYQVGYVLMDENLPDGLVDAYQQPAAIPGLVDVTTVDKTLVLGVEGP